MGRPSYHTKFHRNSQIARPLSGLITAPVIGSIADKSKSRWGRRRPFMVGGALLVTACLFVLGWTAEVVETLFGKSVSNSTTVVVAVITIYVLDFAINAVQWSCRSLIIDTLPISKQALGSAWAGRTVAVGHLIGYGAGALDLEAVFGQALGNTQFKRMTAIAAFSLLFTVGTTSYSVKERVLVTEESNGIVDQLSPFALLARIFNATRHLPTRIEAVCWVQFWAWIGWFPFLFYSSTWVGEIFLKYETTSTFVLWTKDRSGEMGRIGSMSLLIFSIITFAGSVILPWIIKSPDNEAPDFTPRPPRSLISIMEKLEKHKPNLINAWLLSHFMFAFSMFLAPLVRSVRFATVLVAICGIPWALASWAPFTFMGVEINRLSANSGKAGISHTRRSSGLLVGEKAEDTGHGLSGLYLGILNLFTTLPQFIGTFISMIIFTLLEPGKSLELGKTERSGGGPNAISICLFTGALCALGAAYATSRLKRLL